MGRKTKKMRGAGGCVKGICGTNDAVRVAPLRTTRLPNSSAAPLSTPPSNSSAAPPSTPPNASISPPSNSSVSPPPLSVVPNIPPTPFRVVQLYSLPAELLSFKPLNKDNAPYIVKPPDTTIRISPSPDYPFAISNGRLPFKINSIIHFPSSSTGPYYITNSYGNDAIIFYAAITFQNKKRFTGEFEIVINKESSPSVGNIKEIHLMLGSMEVIVDSDSSRKIFKRLPDIIKYIQENFVHITKLSYGNDELYDRQTGGKRRKRTNKKTKKTKRKTHRR